MSGAIPPLPNTPSWRGDQLKHSDLVASSKYNCSTLDVQCRSVTGKACYPLQERRQTI